MLAVGDLGIIFGDDADLESARKTVLDSALPVATRTAALQAIVERRPPDLRTMAAALLPVPSLNVPAAKALASFDDPAIGPQLVDAYRHFAVADRPQLIAALSSRAMFAQSLFDAVAAGSIPASDLSPYIRRQIRLLGDAGLVQRLDALEKAGSDSRTAKEALRAKYAEWLSPAALQAADVKH